MFFSGDHRASKRKVDLRGASKGDSRTSLLEQARKDREQRQKHRTHTKAALRIQAFVRARWAVAAARWAVAVKWTARFGEHGERVSEAGGGEGCRGEWSSATGQRCVRELLFWARPRQLPAVRCVAAVAAELATTHAAALAHPHRATLLLLCVQSLYYHWETFDRQLLGLPESTINEGDCCAALVGAVQALCSCSTADMRTSPGLSLPSSTDAAPMLLHFTQQGGWTLLRTLLQRRMAAAAAAADGCALDGVVRALVGCHLASPAAYEKGAPVMLRLASQLLTLPGVWAAAPVLRTYMARLWAASVLSLHETMCSAEVTDAPGLSALLPAPITPVSCMTPSSIATALGYPSAGWLLGNLVEAAATGLQGAPASTALLFASLVQTLLAATPRSMLPPPPPIESESDDDGEMDVEPAACEIKCRDDRAAPAVLERQLAHLGSTEMLQVVVNQALPLPLPPVASTCTAMPVEAAEAELRVCSLLHTAVNRLLPSDRMRTLSSLAYTAGLVPRLWARLHLCLTHMPTWISQPAAPSAAGEVEVPCWVVPVAVLCPVYSFLLLTTDDEDFYQRGVPLPLDQLPALVHLLKSALSVCLGDGPRSLGKTRGGANVISGGTAPLWRSTRHWLSRLLTQLHDRNCRRRFVKPEAFHSLDAVGTASMLVSEMAQEHSRGRRLLRVAPSLVPFAVRVQCLRKLIALDRAMVRQTPATLPPDMQEFFMGGARLIQVRRDEVMEDGYAGLHALPSNALKSIIRIQFTNALGVAEAGVDGGGLFKDFLDDLVKDSFSPERGLFSVTDEQQVYPNPTSGAVNAEHLRYFEFLGRMLGKAMYEGILVELPFAAFFLSKLRGRENELNDLSSLDADLYRNLMFLKRYEGDVEALSLYLAVTEVVGQGDTRVVDLVPGGRDIPVTAANKLRYIHLMANHHLNTKIKPQCAAFLRGFQELIEPGWMKMFNEEELQMLVSGSREALDLRDLQANAAYSGGYSIEHQVIVWLWETLASFTAEQQGAFLKFVTSCSRPPLLGFCHLEPKFCVQRSGVGGSNAPDDSADHERLPTSATCMNLLKLPPYRSREALRDKLLYAIDAGAGFDLS